MPNDNILVKINSIYRKLEKIGFIKKTPNYIFDYAKDYPTLKVLEENYAIIRKECENILSFKEDITDINSLFGGDGYTSGGIHEIKWKSFVLKAGSFVKENCDQCPETTKLLKKIPKLRMAFFSILEPNQYITPHEGYYNGYMRYHLGVIIPNNNENNECWLRIAPDKIPLDEIDKQGEKYYWKNGEGILFNDNYTHDANNDSDEIRVIMWVDMERKMPFIFSLINTFFLNLVFSTSIMKKIAKNAAVRISKK